MVIPIITGALGTVSNGLENKLGQLGIWERIDIIQLEYLKESWRSEEIYWHSNFKGKNLLKLVEKIHKEWK